MAKLAWNKFISTHGNKDNFAFTAVVSSILPKSLLLDMNDRELPIPYDLFSEWCSSYLSGDWAIMERPNGFIVCLVEKKDAQLIQDEFEVVGSKKITQASKNTYPIGYEDEQYAALAGDLGYVL